MNTEITGAPVNLLDEVQMIDNQLIAVDVAFFEHELCTVEVSLGKLMVFFRVITKEAQQEVLSSSAYQTGVEALLEVSREVHPSCWQGTQRKPVPEHFLPEQAGHSGEPVLTKGIETE